MNVIGLFIRVSAFVTVLFWASTYLLPEPQVRGNAILSIVAGIAAALPISVLYRQVELRTDYDAQHAKGRTITSALASMGFHPQATVDGCTSYSRPGVFGPFASKILVTKNNDHYEIFGPYLEVRRLGQLLK
jgi:hypothetical protein